MTQETLKLALEALETNNKAWKSLADSGDAGWWEAEEQPFFEISVKAITAIKEALAQPEQETPKGWKSEIWKSVKQQEQEPVTWGVDWGKAGDIPCVSIIKRLPDGGSQIMAVEYAPYSYTTPPKQEPVRIMGFDCVCGKRMVVSAEQGVVPAPQRTWQGLMDEEELKLAQDSMGKSRHWLVAQVEAKLKEKNT